MNLYEPSQALQLSTFVMSLSIFTTFSMFAPVPSRKGRPSELLHGGQNPTQHVKESQLTSVS